MALYVNGGKNIIQIIAEKRTVVAIYKGALKVWESVRSCFGSGMWILDKPWLYNEGWRETKRN